MELSGIGIDQMELTPSLVLSATHLTTSAWSSFSLV